MDRLDFGEIMERDECWFENYDLTCPYCHGSGDVTTYKAKCENEDFDPEIDEPEEKGCGHTWEVKGNEYDIEEPNECPTCGNTEIQVEEEVESCEECTNGMFEVMWNTAFGVDVKYGSDDEEMQKIAWENGFCIIEHGHSKYLLMGSCGADMTWRIHWTRWQLQGYLDEEDIKDCLGSGGYCFLNNHERQKMCEYFKDRLPTPEQYASTYEYEVKKIDNIANPKKDVA